MIATVKPQTALDLSHVPNEAIDIRADCLSFLVIPRNRASVAKKKKATNKSNKPIKYEMDKDAGTLVVDRFLYTPMRYPGNYGFVPHTLSDDGDRDDFTVHAATRRTTAKWINHSCKPNCEADEVEGRVYIKALRPIEAGEELSYDYGLVIDAPLTPELKLEYPCWCGVKKCRGTLLSSTQEDLKAPNKRERRAEKKAKHGKKHDAKKAA